MDLEPVASAPRSGEFVVLHDLNGRCETGRWSTPDDDWIQADGSPIRINPTHWQLLLDQTTLDVGFAEYRTQTKSLFRGQWALACAGVAVVLGLSVLTLPSLGSRFNTAADKSKVQLAAAAEPNTTRGIRDAGLASVIAASLRSPDPARPEQEIAQTAKPEPMREGPAPASPQSKDLQVAQAAATQDQGEAADRERERAAAFARDLAAVLEDIETLKVEAATAAAEHLKTQRALQAAQAALTEQRAATERERERNDALARDFSAVVVAELKISEEKAAALDLERQTVASLTRDLAATRQEAEGLKAGIAALETQHRPSPAQRAETVGTANRGERAANAAPEVQRGQPAPALAPPSANEEKVLARADGLIRQGDIKGARLVLERALDTGSAHAAYALAETYDPRMLASWQTYGVRGDPERARQQAQQAIEAIAPQQAARPMRTAPDRLVENEPPTQPEKLEKPQPIRTSAVEDSKSSRSSSFAGSSRTPMECLPEPLKNVLADLRSRFPDVTIVSTTHLHTKNHFANSYREKMHGECKAVDVRTSGSPKAVISYLRSRSEVGGTNSYRDGVVHFDLNPQFKAVASQRSRRS